MRYKFNLKLVDPLRNVLPVNYQYELGSWLYRMINNEEGPLFNYLLSAGYLQKDESFRNFVFSHLIVPDRQIIGDRLVIQSQQVGLIFSTFPDEAFAPFVSANFQGISFHLGDKISQVNFVVQSVQVLPEPEFTDKMTFKTLSPIHLSMKVKGRKNELYLSPETEGFAPVFYENLHQKFKLMCGFDHPHDSLSGKFKLRSPVTQKGVTFQSGTPGENKLIGYQLRFRLQADPALLRAGYYLGFGEKNFLGFGCCTIL